MIIGGICPADVNFGKLFEPSSPYKQDDVTWCVSHAKPMPRWMNLFFIADFWTIVCAAIIVVVVVGIFYLLYAFEDVPRDLLYCAVLTLQTITTFPTMFRSNRFGFKMLFTLALLMTFWITQILSAHICVFLSQVRYKPQITAIDEIVEENFNLAGNPSVTNHFRFKSRVSSFEIIHAVSFNFKILIFLIKSFRRNKFEISKNVMTSINV